MISIGPDWVGETDVRRLGAGEIVGRGDVPARRIAPEYAVGLHVEVAGPLAPVERHLLDAVLDIIADRRALGIEHPGVHREGNPGKAIAEPRLEPREIAHRLTVRAAIDEKQIVLARLGAADGEARALEDDPAAGRRDAVALAGAPQAASESARPAIAASRRRKAMRRT